MPLERILSQRGNNVVISNGYKFVYKQTLKLTGDRVYECEKRRNRTGNGPCRAKIYVNGEEERFQDHAAGQPHNHAPNQQHREVRS